MGELNAAMNSVANNAMRIVRIVDAFDKVDNALTLVSMASEMPRIMSALSSYVTSALSGRSEPGFSRMLQDYDGAMLVLLKASNFGRIGRELATLPIQRAKVSEFISNKDNNLLFYGPTPYSLPWLSVGNRIKVGSIQLSKSRRDIVLELGTSTSNKGRVIGVGHTYGKSKTGDKQWFRMDWHDAHGNEDWVDSSGFYHFHTTRI